MTFLCAAPQLPVTLEVTLSLEVILGPLPVNPHRTSKRLSFADDMALEGVNFDPAVFDILIFDLGIWKFDI